MSDSDLTIFCRQVRKRSQENKEAMSLLHASALMANVMGVLRQELDSMVRCAFLLSVTDKHYREQLLHDSVIGNPWRKRDGKGRITDREMIDLASRWNGWVGSVYKFGCGCIHLSAFHDYSDRDPFDLLSPEDRHDVEHYLHSYHGVVMTPSTRLDDIKPVLPKVFKKISDNLEGYVKELEGGPDFQP